MFLSMLASSDMQALNAIFDSDSIPIIVDSGATVTLSNSKHDFVSYTPYTTPRMVTGITSGLSLEGHGTISWQVVNDLGIAVPFIIHNAQYVPQLPTRLLSPQQLLEQDADPKRYFTLYPTCAVLRWDWNLIQIQYDPSSRLPTLYTAEGGKRYAAFLSTVDHSTTDPVDCSSAQLNTPRLTKHEQAYLRWHQKLGHPSEATMQLLAKHERIPPWLAKVKAPLCKACLFGKQTKRQKKDTGDLRARFPDVPGACVSVDQFISHTPGRVLTFSGKPTTKTHSCVTLFIDHATDKIYCYSQLSTEATETLEGKTLFEQMAFQHNVQILHYHCDNGIFRSQAFVDHCRRQGQSLSFCGVGAHHQNGIAERAVRTITVSARTMLLHAHNLWPDVIKFDLWPFAVKLATDIHNAIPTSRTEGITPDELFSGALPGEQCRLKDTHVFGCPVFVLDDRLQNGQRINRWDPRARQGAFLGFSSHHANNVAYVLNPRTNEISPQYHVVFDDLFQTVDVQKTNILSDEVWDGLNIPHNIINHELESGPAPSVLINRWSETSTITSPPEPIHYSAPPQTRETLPQISKPLDTADPQELLNQLTATIQQGDGGSNTELTNIIEQTLCNMLERDYPKAAERAKQNAERSQIVTPPFRQSNQVREPPVHLKLYDVYGSAGFQSDAIDK